MSSLLTPTGDCEQGRTRAYKDACTCGVTVTIQDSCEHNSMALSRRESKAVIAALCLTDGNWAACRTPWSVGGMEEETKDKGK